MTHLDELSNIAQNWFAAFNEHDIEKLLLLYDDEASHYSPKLKVRHPETHGLIKGKTALRTWWQDAFLRLPTLKYELIRLTPYEDRIFMEYIPCWRAFVTRCRSWLFLVCED
ncbi:MAG: nuclear transport factor 2 family protein [Cytophagales bacterium]|jgi:hypothetical protein|nr:nuclear transport factor 2 family protein [Cytophagales bacterium]MCA6366062.1 nuclear transport factor 2 family protein [Cytophagales bacterium]MCA6373017.1 nuclear transport factor 2 family protein [Cytophagales bacterium]MCA6375973.1 nuclear transport factor 2 family protein [Cytophagales bacterium]MCA6383482.1 nuclear transport factor 2 family protein [Cytophagales bacterium]